MSYPPLQSTDGSFEGEPLVAWQFSGNSKTFWSSPPGKFVTPIDSTLSGQLRDRYVIERELSRCGMATVYLAQDLKRQRPVALKVLHRELAAALSFSQVSTGMAHACGLTPDQRLYCWGWNYNGQLGDGTSGGVRSRPCPVSGSLRFREVSASGSHTCGVTTSSRAFCWGENRYGQIGDSTEASQRLTPTRVATGARSSRSTPARGTPAPWPQPMPRCFAGETATMGRWEPAGRT